MGMREDFLGLLRLHGSDVHFHRADSMLSCPCLTPEGFRDPEWHLEHPTAPVCNEQGMLPDLAHTTDLMIRAFVQPAQSTRATRMSPEYMSTLFGEIQQGDHLGLLPEEWNGVKLELYDWGQSGEDWIGYNGRYFMVVAANLLATPDTGDPRGHWECGLRLIDTPIGAS